jgi:alpha/beta superfamily hydrolase
MSDELRIAGAREVRATVDTPESETVVVACPPHPQMGGSRTDPRLRAVGEALGAESIACLRFDYGPWDDGDGEQQDTANVLAHARDTYERVGLFGYSFGAGIALLVAADSDPDPAALSVLAPPAAPGRDFDTAGAVEDVNCPVQVLYGEQDSTVDWEPVVGRARERGYSVESYPVDHFFVGQVEEGAGMVATFFDTEL